MKTIDFLHTLNHSNKKLSFLLPGSEAISGDLHITEVKNTHIISTDCGGNSHEFEETVIQLWINENSGLTPKWTTKKASGIFDIVASSQPFLEDAEVFIEFGDSTRPTSKYKIQVQESEGELKVHLVVDLPQCKPAALNDLACC